MAKIYVIFTCPNKYIIDYINTNVIRFLKYHISNHVKYSCILDRDIYGSGGATLNALIYAVELISAFEGYKNANMDILAKYLIVIINIGDVSLSYPYGGTAFTLTNNSNLCLYNCVAIVESILRHLTNNWSLVGLWIASTSMLLNLNEDIEIDKNLCQIISMPVPVKNVANQHGFFTMDNNGNVEALHYRKTFLQISNILHVNANCTEKVPVVLGLIFLPCCVVGKLIEFYVNSPLKLTSIEDVKDTSFSAFKISLFFDILYPMFSGAKENDFINKDIPLQYIPIRRFLWDTLHNYDLKIVFPKDGSVKFLHAHEGYINPNLSAFNDTTVFRNETFLTSKAKSIFNFGHDSYGFGLTNLLKKYGEDLNVKIGEIKVPDNTLIYCVDINVDLKMADLLEGQSKSADLNAKNNQIIYVIDTNDNIEIEQNMTLFGRPFANFLTAHHIMDIHDIWPETEITKKDYNSIIRCQNLYNAKLFPLFVTREEFFKYGLPFIQWFMQNDNPISGETLSSFSYKQWKKCIRLSLREIYQNLDVSSMFNHQKELWLCKMDSEIKCNNFDPSITLPLTKLYLDDWDLLPSWVTSLKTQAQTLDDLNPFMTITIKSDNDGKRRMDMMELKKAEIYFIYLGHLCRTLTIISGYIALCCGPRGGLLLGIAVHKKHYSTILNHINNNQIGKAIANILDYCTVPLSNKNPDEQMNRARIFYQTSQYILAKQMSLLYQEPINAKLTPIKSFLPKSHVWLITAPARIDLCGGWTDTPPIYFTNKHKITNSFRTSRKETSQLPPIISGAVLNMAIKLNGQNPIGVLVRKMSKPIIELRYGTIDTSICPSNIDEAVRNCFIPFSPDNEINSHNPHNIIRFERYTDFTNLDPKSKGALFKAAISLTKFICLQSTVHSKYQSAPFIYKEMLEKYGCGFQFFMFTAVPEGSGLGTSSILAGCLLATFYTIQNVSFTRDEIIEKVLLLEQMLSTGGGWQDQIGGMMGGVNFGYTIYNDYPYKIHCERVLNSCILRYLDRNLLLFYTGKSRLAKNILQEVIQNWYYQDSHIVQTVKNLCENCLDCYNAIKSDNIKQFAQCVNTYRTQKVAMASQTSEPAWLTAMLDSVLSIPRVGCVSFAGAGGGGFAYAFTQCSDETYGDNNGLLEKELGKIGNAKIFNGSLDNVGLCIYNY